MWFVLLYVGLVVIVTLVGVDWLVLFGLHACGFAGALAIGAVVACLISFGFLVLVV